MKGEDLKLIDFTNKTKEIDNDSCPCKATSLAICLTKFYKNSTNINNQQNVMLVGYNKEDVLKFRL